MYEFNVLCCKQFFGPLINAIFLCFFYQNSASVFCSVYLRWNDVCNLRYTIKKDNWYFILLQLSKWEVWSIFCNGNSIPFENRRCRPDLWPWTVPVTPPPVWSRSVRFYKNTSLLAARTMAPLRMFAVLFPLATSAASWLSSSPERLRLNQLGLPSVRVPVCHHGRRRPRRREVSSSNAGLGTLESRVVVVDKTGTLTEGSQTVQS